MRFFQSINDFPCPVSLGEKVPSFGLHRYKKGLRFFPLDNEAFSLRGDRRQLVYKGRRRSHRFTILCDTAFEYDCILLKEPESNVVTLLMDGAENYDFFRQPDFLTDPLLAGSYAVYQKETLIGEGTGKLCHIHRPEIIDAAGRRCWGELSVSGKHLYITIPEKWLGEAKYPVVVDPTIGTTTIGSQTKYRNDDGDLVELTIEASIGVNRFLISENLNANTTATAYAYAYNNDSEGVCKPVIYSDNSNKPLTRRSTSEGNFDIEVRSGKTASWRSTTFKTNTAISSGNYIWYGLFCDWFYPRFDYGAKFYNDYLDGEAINIPNTYPITNYYYDYKLSMYFSYISAQDYKRTITQGIKLTDNRTRISNFKRSILQSVGLRESLSRLEGFCRKCTMTLYNSMRLYNFNFFFRYIKDAVPALALVEKTGAFVRLFSDEAKTSSDMNRHLSIFRNIENFLFGEDRQSIYIFFSRTLNENLGIGSAIKHCWEITRKLNSTAGNTAEAPHGAEYKRFHSDGVSAVGNLFRGLFLFIRLASEAVFKDYILSRFLKAREEIILKSPVCRELVLESNIGG